MKKVPWYVSPPAIFVFSLISIIGAIAFYVYWSVKYQYGIERYLTKFNLSPDPLLEINTWLTILVYSLFIGVVLVGLIVIYVYYHRLIKLFRLQNNLISNFTHELKTPLASIRLQADVISNLLESSKNKQLQSLSERMIEDAKNLETQMDKILQLSRMEQGGNLNPSNLEIHSFIKETLSKWSLGEQDFQIRSIKKNIQVLLVCIPFQLFME